MALERNRLNDALAANGYLDRGRKLYAPASVQGYALPEYNRCIYVVSLALEYIINNGPESSKQIADLLKKSVKTAYGFLALKNTEMGGSKYTSLVKQTDDYYAHGCPQDAQSLGLAVAVNKCVKSSTEAIIAMDKDIDSVDEAEYEKINEEYLGRLSYAGIDQWRENVKAVIKDARKTLTDIKADLVEVVDNSSVLALGDAQSIVERIKVWRDVSIYSYLMLEATMTDALHDAKRIADDWAARLLGVSKKKNNPRADDAAVAALNSWDTDQTQRYLNASKV